MGKVKTKRAPLHAKAAKVPGTASVEPAAFETTAPIIAPTPPTKLDGIFSKVDIDLNAMSRDLPGKDFDDTRSAITSKSMKGMNLKKSEKMKIRKEFFLKKIDTLKQAKKEAKAKKKREKTAVVGDMQGLADTLPTLDLLLRDLQKPQASVSKEAKESGEKTRGVQKESRRKKQMKEEMDTFRQVLDYPVYKADPLSTITEHLRNKLKQESEEMDT